MTKEKKDLKKGIENRLQKLTEEVNEINIKYKRDIKDLKQKLVTKTRNDLESMQLATKARYRRKGEKCTS
jgi:F0F1-type ATP synthase membrane subunit b/b'